MVILSYGQRDYGFSKTLKRVNACRDQIGRQRDYGFSKTLKQEALHHHRKTSQRDYGFSKTLKLCLRSRRRQVVREIMALARLSNK